jgi:transposase
MGGERVNEGVPAGRWSTLTVLGAVSISGWVATMSIEAPTDGDVFLAYLEHVLCPQLKPGQIVVMDNLGAHKVDGVKELIYQTGASLLYLPPYSPDFNPIEKCRAQLKQRMRALKARFSQSTPNSARRRPLCPFSRRRRRLLQTFRLWTRFNMKML